MTVSLKNRVAVVTGGASGLGAATASALRNSGASVALLDHDAGAVNAAAAAIGAAAFVADVSDGPAVERVFEEIEAQLGRISILVNCAGIAEPGSVVKRGVPMPLDEYRRVINVNLLGMINCIRCAVPQMIEGRVGSDIEAGLIINTSSIAAFDGQMGQAAYSASKGGVAGMVLPLARELGDYGIRVMGIAPGVFETPMTLNLSAKSRRVVFSAVPPYPKRPGQPEEFAELVLAIVSNKMLNGEVIRLDGGLRMPARL